MTTAPARQSEPRTRRQSVLSLAILLLAGFAGCALGPMPPQTVQYGWRIAEQSGDLIPFDDKAQRLIDTVEAHHLTPEGLYAYRVPYPLQAEAPVAEYSDALAWTSLLAVALSLRARVMGEEAQPQLERVLRGLDHLARVSGTPGLLARSMVPAGTVELDQEVRRWVPGQGEHDGVDYTQHCWKTDNAKAQVQCWTLAMMMAWPHVGSADLRRHLREDVSQVTQRIVDAGYNLTEADGTQARFGDLHPASHGAAAWFLKPIQALPFDFLPFIDLAVGPNAAASLSLARMHDEVIGRETYAPALEEAGFEEYVRDGAYRVLWVHHHGNDFLAMMGLWALWESDPDEELRRFVRQAARDVFERHRHDRNALYGLLALEMDLVDQSERDDLLDDVLYTLAIYPLDRRVYEVDHREARWLTPGRRPTHAAHALPINLQRSSSIAWNSDPSRLNGREGKKGEQVHGGMDYLLAYWLARDLERRGRIRALPTGLLAPP